MLNAADVGCGCTLQISQHSKETSQQSGAGE